MGGPVERVATSVVRNRRIQEAPIILADPVSDRLRGDILGHDPTGSGGTTSRANVRRTLRSSPSRSSSSPSTPASDAATGATDGDAGDDRPGRRAQRCAAVAADGVEEHGQV